MIAVRILIGAVALFAGRPARLAAQTGSPLGSAQLQVSGARLTLYNDGVADDAVQTINVGEPARVRTCYGGACGTAGLGSIPGLKVIGDLSGPELPQAIPYETAPGGTFFLPGFQREGDYLLSNIRLVETGTGRVLANAEPSLATLHVAQIVLASASITRLTLADLAARGITITQQNFNAFGYVGGPGGPDGSVPGAAKWKLGWLSVGTDPGAKNFLPFGDAGAPGSSAFGQFRYGYDSAARDGTKLGRAVAAVGLAAGSILSQQGFAYGLDAAKRLETAHAGAGSVVGADAASAIAAFERFKYEYGAGDQLQKETREVDGHAVGYEPGSDGRPDSRQLDPDLSPGGPKVLLAYDGLKRRIADDRFTFTWHYDGKIAEAVVKDCWPIEHDESQAPDCAAGFTRPVQAGHKLVFAYDALSRLLTRTHLGPGATDAERPFIETREYLFDSNTLLAEVAKAQDGAIRWRKTYVPGADIHDHVQVRVEIYDAAQNLVSDRLYAYVRDEQGTVLALADEASDPSHPSIPIRYLYTPYGNAHAETGPELRKGSYVFGLNSVKDSSGTNRTQDATGALPGGIRLSFGIDVDKGTFGGILLERRETDGTWGALTAADVAIGRATDAANSDVDVLPLKGLAFATSYRVRTTAGLKDILGRTLADPKVLELPQTPPVIAAGDISASSFEYDRRFPVDYDSVEAASNDANGIFPGGQPMGFQGQFTDPLLGFLLTPNRAYDARNGVWLSQDPMGDTDSPNLYGFVGMRPHEMTDPLGLAEQTPEMKDQACRVTGAGCSNNVGITPDDFAAAGQFLWRNTLGSARFRGLLKAGGGTLEMIAGGAGWLTPEPTMLTKVGGTVALAHGYDTARTGVRQWKSGQEEKTSTQQTAETVLRDVGTPPEWAEFGGRMVDAGAGAGGTALAMRGAAGLGSVPVPVPPPTPAQILQGVTNRVNAELAANPALARGVLSPAEYAAGQGRMGAVQYGNAVERLVAQEIANDAALRQMFSYIGGPKRVDFVGRLNSPAAGMRFDITTPAEIASHLARPYGPGLNVITYTRPAGFAALP